MDLTPVQIRVLGSLLEKAATTPDQYPLSTNALVTACNQKSSRDPVVQLTEREVTDAIFALRNDYQLARSSSAGGRTQKHRHIVDETWGLNEEQQAVLAVLALRGAQTPGELRTRTERYVGFPDVEAVETILLTLAEGDDPFVVDLGRQPGQSQNRWTHLLSGEPVVAEPTVGRAAAPRAAGTTSSSALVERIDQLEARLAALEAELGISPRQES
ncbi:MAG: YceH family protein [Acidimicrobiales bacterium]